MKIRPKQKEVYETAKKLFVKKGYAETSKREIAAELGVTAATLYSHINSKEEILDWICEDVFNRFNTGLQPLIESNLSVEKKFTEFIRIYITECLIDIDKFEVYNRYWSQSDKNYEKFANGKAILNHHLNLLIKANLAGDRKLDCFEEDATVKIMLLILRNVPYYVSNKENPDIECVVQEIQDRLLFGYAPR